MLGAIAGDIIGSVYERFPLKTKSFPLFHPGGTFTDDTVLTVAIAEALLEGEPYSPALRRWARRYPDAGYGASFLLWMRADSEGAYGSWGNGSAMRVSPVGWAFEDLEETLAEAARSAAVTHDHPQGIQGAEATALAIFLARHGVGQEELRTDLGEMFLYDLDRTLDEIRPHYTFDVSCQGSVPESILAFLESENWEDSVRLAVSLGGDSDTMAAIAGSLAEAFYGGVPEEVVREVERRLPREMWQVVEAFNDRFPTPDLP